MVDVMEHPLSTFSVDVDTSAYAYVRKALTSHRLPPPQAVRVEEMVNYFPYNHPRPNDRRRPFAVTPTVLPAPWSEESQLVHIALNGYDIPHTRRPRANLVLLIDVSGSMSGEDRLPLLKRGFRELLEQLNHGDRVSIVTYADRARVALEPTPGSDCPTIADVIDGLRATGGTAGSDGLELAYALAQRHFDPSAVNRVILATDGDFNIGRRNPQELERFIAAKRRTGVYLSILGVGQGNLNEALMQRLAQAGNGNAAYIDSLLEAGKVLNEELSSTLFPIANDVKVQVEFNPQYVAAYRLIGYETRQLRREDFRNDRVDAGDMGAGHTVTAIYEVIPANARAGESDRLRYADDATPGPLRRDNTHRELAFIKLRYKLPGETVSQTLEVPVLASRALRTVRSAPTDVRFSVAVAAFAQRLRGEAAVEDYSYAEMIKLADESRGRDPGGYRAEFVQLLRLAAALERRQR